MLWNGVILFKGFLEHNAKSFYVEFKTIKMHLQFLNQNQINAKQVQKC